MKVVFLDIDGVMNLPKNPLSDKHEGLAFSEESATFLRDIVEELDYHIVISSSWRVGKDLDYFKTLLGHYGISGDRVVGMTEYYFDTDVKDRSEEILEFVKENKDVMNITNFVALDDMEWAWFGYAIGKHLVKIGKNGLSKYDKRDITRRMDLPISEELFKKGN